MRRKRLYEEMETEDMDSFDDTDYEFEEPQSTDTKDISSQIKTIVDRELKKIQTRDNPSTTQTESSQD